MMLALPRIEVVVKRGGVRARCRENRAKGHAVDPVLGHEPFGGVHDGGLGVFLGGGGHDCNSDWCLLIWKNTGIYQTIQALD